MASSFMAGSAVGSNLIYRGARPLDGKTVAQNKEEVLANLDVAFRFQGLVIYLIDESCFYVFKNSTADDDFVPLTSVSSDFSFEDFSETKTYAMDDYIVYDNKLYQAIAESIGTWEDTKDNFKLIIGSIEDTFIKIKEVYDEANTYSIDDIVIYNGLVYKAIVETTGVFDRDSWELLIGVEEDKEVIKIKEWKIDTEYLEEAFVIYNNNLYKCNTAHTSTDTFDEINWDLILKGESTEGIEITEFDKTLVYEVGDYVIYNRCVYRCIVETTADTDFD